MEDGDFVGRFDDDDDDDDDDDCDDDGGDDTTFVQGRKGWCVMRYETESHTDADDTLNS